MAILSFQNAWNDFLGFFFGSRDLTSKYQPYLVRYDSDALTCNGAAEGDLLERGAWLKEQVEWKYTSGVWPKGRKVIVLAHSMGGLIAQRIALRHPDRVKSLASISAMPSDAGRLAGLRYLHLGFIRATSSLRFPDTPEGDLQTAMAVAKLCASPGYPWDEAATLEWLRQVPTDGVRDSGAQARQMRATWHGPRLKDISAPTLILHGDRDPVVRPTAARAIAGQVAGSEVDILPGVGHDLPQPLYAALAARIRANATRATSPD